MRRATAAAALLLLLAGAGRAGEAPRFCWEREGLASVAGAAAGARAAGKRLLLGLSGSPT